MSKKNRFCWCGSLLFGVHHFVDFLPSPQIDMLGNDPHVPSGRRARQPYRCMYWYYSSFERILHSIPRDELDFDCCTFAWFNLNFGVFWYVSWSCSVCHMCFVFHMNAATVQRDGPTGTVRQPYCCIYGDIGIKAPFEKNLSLNFPWWSGFWPLYFCLIQSQI